MEKNPGLKRQLTGFGAGTRLPAGCGSGGLGMSFLALQGTWPPCGHLAALTVV